MEVTQVAPSVAPFRVVKPRVLYLTLDSFNRTHVYGFCFGGAVTA
jgi:hypothetical protein